MYNSAINLSIALPIVEALAIVMMFFFLLNGVIKKKKKKDHRKDKGWFRQFRMAFYSDSVQHILEMYTKTRSSIVSE